MSFLRSRVQARTHRLIASRFPTVGVFDDIAASEEELRVAFLLEDLTNVRSHARLNALPPHGVASGPTASIAMAAFLHCAPEGGRFSDGDLGAWYGATDLSTAIAETVYHHERRLRASAAGFPARIQMRELVVRALPICTGPNSQEVAVAFSISGPEGIELETNQEAVALKLATEPAVFLSGIWSVYASPRDAVAAVKELISTLGKFYPSLNR